MSHHFELNSQTYKMCFSLSPLDTMCIELALPSQVLVRQDTNCWVLLQLVSIPFELAYLLIVQPPSQLF